MTDNLQITYETDATLADIAANGKRNARRVDEEVERINAEFRSGQSTRNTKPMRRFSPGYQLQRNTHLGRLYGGGWG